MAPVPLLGSLICGLVLLSSEPAPIATQDLRSALEAQQQWLQAKEIRFQTTILGGRGSHVIPAGSEIRFFDRIEEHTSMILGSTFRMTREVVATSDVGAHLLHERRALTFDGVEYRWQRSGVEEDTRYTEFDILLQSQALMFRDHSLSWQGWWVFQSPEGRGYIDFLNMEALEGPRLRTDGRTEWWIPAVPSEGREELRLIASRSESHVWLDEAHLVNYTRQSVEGAMDPRMVFAVHFSMPAFGQGVLISPAAEVRCFVRLTNPEKSSWSVTRISLTGVRTLESLPREYLRPSPADGVFVRDERYRIAYEVGGTELIVDGRVARVSEPLPAEVGDQLEVWIRKARFED